MHPLTASLLYKFTERIPENIEEVRHILQAIAEKNISIHPGSDDSDWPTLFSPTEDHCLLCGTLLSDQLLSCLPLKLQV